MKNKELKQGDIVELKVKGKVITGRIVGLTKSDWGKFKTRFVIEVIENE